MTLKQREIIERVVLAYETDGRGNRVLRGGDVKKRREIYDDADPGTVLGQQDLGLEPIAGTVQQGIAAPDALSDVQQDAIAGANRASAERDAMKAERDAIKAERDAAQKERNEKRAECDALRARVAQLEKETADGLVIPPAPE